MYNKTPEHTHVKYHSKYIARATSLLNRAHPKGMYIHREPKSAAHFARSRGKRSRFPRERKATHQRSQQPPESEHRGRTRSFLGSQRPTHREKRETEKEEGKRKGLGGGRHGSPLSKWHTTPLGTEAGGRYITSRPITQYTHRYIPQALVCDIYQDIIIHQRGHHIAHVPLINSMPWKARHSATGSQHQHTRAGTCTEAGNTYNSAN